MIHLSQLIGGVLWRMHHKSDSIIIDEELELRNALRTLEHRPEPPTLVSIYCLLAWYFMFKRQLEEGRNYLVKAYRVVMDNGLQLSGPTPDPLDRITEPDEDTKEHVTALSQLLYLDKAGIIVLNMPSVLNDEYDRQMKALPASTLFYSRNSMLTSTIAPSTVDCTELCCDHART